MKYDVHIYPIVRVKVAGIEADSPEAAIAIAGKAFNLSNESAPEIAGTAEFEWLDESAPYALVDIAGDDEYQHSAWFDRHGTNWVKCNE